MKTNIIFVLALVVCGVCDAAIVFPKPPDGGERMVRRNLDAHLLKTSRFEDLTITNAHRDYFIGPADLAAGRLLSVAESRSWRYPITLGTNLVGVGVVGVDAKTGKVQRFNALYDTYSAPEMFQALRVAERLPQVKERDYEVRFIGIVPPICFAAVWLHAETDDILIPLPPTFERWKAYQPYSEKQMIELLKPEAKKLLKQPSGMIN